MIDVFETWFNQFSKVEQEKLLKHIFKNHALDSKDYFTSYPEKVDKKKYETSLNSPIRRVCQVKSIVER